MFMELVEILKKKHQNFIEKHQLNFDLLVDEDYKLADEAGVYQLKNLLVKRVWGSLELHL